MGKPVAEFWHHVGAVRELVKNGRTSEAVAALEKAQAEIAPGTPGGDKRAQFLQLMATTCDLPVPGALPHSTKLTRTLGKIRTQTLPGVSLVTCCRNRNENLLQSLQSWIACPDISEIIIVDWTSDDLVWDDICAHKLRDPRIRVIRVEDEPRWILSYAFNTGFRCATYDKILKADADIVIQKDFFEKNQLGKGEFLAGNWRTAPAGQEFLNGFFYIWTQDLARIGGFNEYITTYGWDDDEIYQRLTNASLQRRDIDPYSAHHLAHSDDERTGNDTPCEPADTAPTTKQALTSDTLFMIRRNRFISNAMPEWSSKSTPLPINILSEDFNGARMKRAGWLAYSVPEIIEKDADFYAVSEIASWKFGARVRELPEQHLEAMLSKPVGRVNRLDVEVALDGAIDVMKQATRYVLIRLNFAQSTEPDPEVLSGISALRSWATERGLTPVLFGPVEKRPPALSEQVPDLPFVCTWQFLSETSEISLATMKTLDGSCATKSNTPLLVRLDNQPKVPSAAEILLPRKKIYVDAQHGMGNRLRAIGSAAAIAEQTGRELVIVWQPDHHCDCRFSDLFEYDGAVVENSFVETARQLDLSVYNYMEIEPDSQKDAPIQVNSTQDIYVRSAFVLASDLTDWKTENRFIQSLTPVEAVRDLVASVRLPNDVSAHVRMQAGKGLDENTYDSPEGNWSHEDHEQIQFWRAKSHFSHFIRRLEELIAEGEAETIFVAADLPETYNAFAHHFEDRVCWLPRSVNDRSAEQLRYGLADAILLGRSRRLLGSHWSSFSELAMRLAPQALTVEMSGKDF